MRFALYLAAEVKTTDKAFFLLYAIALPCHDEKDGAAFATPVFVWLILSLSANLGPLRPELILGFIVAHQP